MMLHHSPPSHRRGFLRKTLGAYWTGAALLEQSIFRAAQARAQANPGLPKLFNIRKVADGVYAAIGQASALINSNAAIFEMSDGLLVVDTHSKPSAVFSLVSQIKKEVSTKPVKYIVNSHFHWDHTQGERFLEIQQIQVELLRQIVRNQPLAVAGSPASVHQASEQ